VNCADFFAYIYRCIGMLPVMGTTVTTERKRGPVMAIVVPIAILVAWIILQACVLPRLGVKT